MLSLIVGIHVHKVRKYGYIAILTNLTYILVNHLIIQTYSALFRIACY